MHLPTCFAAVIVTFAPLFVQQRTWRHAEVLVIGAILAPGRRTVASILRVAGLARERRFANYHRLLRISFQNALMRFATMKMQAAVRRARTMRPSRSRRRSNRLFASNQAQSCSTTLRTMPSPEPCGAPI